MSADFECLVVVAASGHRLSMLTVDIVVLKAELSRYIRAVANGETVLVTDGERVVAEIVPPRSAVEPTTPAAKPKTPDEKWAELIRLGYVTPAKEPRSLLPLRQPAIMTLEELMREIDADRSDR